MTATVRPGDGVVRLARMADKFYFNVSTGQVEQGNQSPGADLMGPYDTEQEAANAYQTAQARTDAWDEQDRQWDEGEK